MKDIKEYLPFYLGQKVKVVDGKWQGTIGIFSGFDSIAEDAMMLRDCNTNFKPDEDFIEDARAFLINKVKLLLRPLSSMTEEEAIKIANIVIGSFDSVKWKVEKKFQVVNEVVTDKFTHFYIHKKHRGYSKSLSIDECGEIDVYDDDTIDQYLHQHEVTRTLLKMGFDIFNLIPEGLALDITTQKT